MLVNNPNKIIITYIIINFIMINFTLLVDIILYLIYVINKKNNYFIKKN